MVMRHGIKMPTHVQPLNLDIHRPTGEQGLALDHATDNPFLEILGRGFIAGAGGKMRYVFQRNFGPLDEDRGRAIGQVGCHGSVRVGDRDRSGSRAGRTHADIAGRQHGFAVGGLAAYFIIIGVDFGSHGAS